MSKRWQTRLLGSGQRDTHDMSSLVVIAAISLAAWIYLLFARGWFWLARPRDNWVVTKPSQGWPSVVAVVPARDEASVIEQPLRSLVAQEYQGDFRIIVVDDQSSDGTAEIARRCDTNDRLQVVFGTQRPAGWTGKIWAQQQGIVFASAKSSPDYFWLTDADIVHDPGMLARLVSRTEQGFVLVSLMAKLRCASLAERMFVPAFVYFFCMLYPFVRVTGRGATAAAAGGCMLASRKALEAAGGLASINTEIIDDCALARRLKQQGRISLSLTNNARSIRPYADLPGISHMVTRSAYAQLEYSIALLLGTNLAMTLVFVAPTLLAIFANGTAQLLGAVAWFLMAFSFQPMLRFYYLSPLWGAALPVIAAFYAGFTLESALDFWRGRGGMWKGRAQAIARS